MPSKNQRRKFYAVRVGRCPGIYHDWATAQRQVTGFPGAAFKGFTLLNEAMTFMAGGDSLAPPQASPADKHHPSKGDIVSPPAPAAQNQGIIDLSMDSDGESIVDLTMDDISEPPRSVLTTPAETKPDSTPTNATQSYTDFCLASSLLPSSQRRNDQSAYDEHGSSSSGRRFARRSLADHHGDSLPHKPCSATPEKPISDKVKQETGSSQGQLYGPKDRDKSRSDRPTVLLDEPHMLDEPSGNHSGRDQRSVPRYGHPPPVYANPALQQHLGTDPPLSPQQQAVVDRAVRGDSLFFTGSAGTGKSVLLRAVIDRLKDRSLAITASTGMAALNIGGCTLHSWSGVQLGEGSAEYLLSLVKRSDAYKRWRRTSVLIVDEVSMLHGDLLDKLDEIGRTVRGGAAPFGGLQIIFSGDFFQLPPVAKNGKKFSYAFDSNVWDRLFPRSNFVTLERVFRQSDDTFVECLESMRRGVVRAEHDALLHSLDRRLDTKDGIKPVVLFSKRADVERENMNKLRVIDAPYVHYDAEDHGGVTTSGRPVSDVDATDLLNDRSRWPQFLPLKVGAQVMLVTNWKPGLVNGSTGRVVDFMTLEEALNDPKVHVPEDAGEAEKWWPRQKWPVVKFKDHPKSATWPPILIPRMEVDIENANHRPEATRIQLPLILAWAITIHKSQGLTLDKVRVDLSGAFDCGQAYVALSRATSLEGLELRGYSRSRIMTSERVLKWAQEMEEDKEWDELLAGADFVNDY